MSKYMELLQAYEERIAELRALDSDLRLKAENFTQGLKDYFQVPDRIVVHENGHTINALSFGRIEADGSFIACNRFELPSPKNGEVQFAIVLALCSGKHRFAFEEEISISKDSGNYVLQFLTSSVIFRLQEEAGQVNFSPAYKEVYDLINARFNS